MIRLFVFLCVTIFPLLGSTGYAYDETYEKAVRHFKGREYRSAIPYLEKYVSRNPDPAGYYMLGYALNQLGNYEKSREYFDQAYLIDPDFSSEKVPAHAGLSDAEERLVHDALELSGAMKQMDYYSGMVRSSVPEVQRAMSRERTRQDLRTVFGESFGQSRLYSSAVSFFISRFNKTYITATVQWLKSQLGRKMAGCVEHTGESLEPRDYELLSRCQQVRVRDVIRAHQVFDRHVKARRDGRETVPWLHNVDRSARLRKHREGSAKQRSQQQDQQQGVLRHS